MTDTEQIIAFLNARLAELNALVEKANEPEKYSHGASKHFYSSWGEHVDDWSVYIFNIPPEAVSRLSDAIQFLIDTDICTACSVEHQPCDVKNDALLAFAGIWNNHPDYLKLSIL